MFGWIVAHLARWLPHATPTGLYPIGDPDRHSPVLVTANFSLTVERVRHALSGRDVWLLVVFTEGINVWCAAAARIFTHHRVIDAIKVSDLVNRVDHREVILPALCAPGVDRKAIREATGFHVRFGPIYARDIAAYLDAGKRKSDAMLRFRFDLHHRLEMMVPMNLPFFLGLAIVPALFWYHLLLGATLFFWGAVVLLYLLVPYIPGRSGWTQALLSAGVVVLGWAALDWIRLGDPLHHWGWYLGTIGIFLMVGLDLAGTTTARKSDPEKLLHRLGVKSIGSLFSEKDIGEITLERERCNGCKICWEICPVGVYGDLDENNKRTFKNRDACFNCGACVKQCPTGALAIRAGGNRRTSTRLA
jgi:NAD-dependent dihydropyrimidine dehydrogenase PreA subunit